MATPVQAQDFAQDISVRESEFSSSRPFAPMNSLQAPSRQGPLPPSLSTNDWIIDSGATIHICCRLNLFKSSRALESMVSFHAVGDGYVASRVGKVELTLRNNELLALDNVYWVPKMKCNLLSTVQLIREGLSFVQDIDGCYFHHSPSGRLFYHGSRYSDLTYRLDLAAPCIAEPAVRGCSLASVQENHASVTRGRLHSLEAATTSITYNDAIEKAEQKNSCPASPVDLIALAVFPPLAPIPRTQNKVYKLNVCQMCVEHPNLRDLCNISADRPCTYCLLKGVENCRQKCSSCKDMKVHCVRIEGYACERCCRFHVNCEYYAGQSSAAMPSQPPDSELKASDLVKLDNPRCHTIRRRCQRCKHIREVRCVDVGGLACLNCRVKGELCIDRLPALTKVTAITPEASTAQAQVFRTGTITAADQSSTPTVTDQLYQKTSIPSTEVTSTRSDLLTVVIGSQLPSDPTIPIAGQLPIPFESPYNTWTEHTNTVASHDFTSSILTPPSSDCKECIENGFPCISYQGSRCWNCIDRCKNCSNEPDWLKDGEFTTADSDLLEVSRSMESDPLLLVEMDHPDIAGSKHPASMGTQSSIFMATPTNTPHAKTMSSSEQDMIETSKNNDHGPRSRSSSLLSRLPNHSSADLIPTDMGAPKRKHNREVQAKYRRNNREKIKVRQRERYAEKMKDPVFRAEATAKACHRYAKRKEAAKGTLHGEGKDTSLVADKSKVVAE